MEAERKPQFPAFRAQSGRLDPDRPLSAQELRGALQGTIFSDNIFCHQVLESTNLVLKEMAAKGSPSGTVVLCEEQTAGRGRRGRRWLSAPFKNLLFSVLIRPDIHVSEAFLLTLAMALATAESIDKEVDFKAMIKWPNDIYLEGKKVGGILTEFSTYPPKGESSQDKVQWAVIGLGLNVNWAPPLGPPGREGNEGLLYESTSLTQQAGRLLDRQSILVQILKGLDGYLKELQQGGKRAILSRCETRWFLKDKNVVIRVGQGGACLPARQEGEPEGIIKAKVLAHADDGSLVVLTDDGRVERLVFGDVSVSPWEPGPALSQGATEKG